MQRDSAREIARVLRVLVAVTFGCNLCALPLVPGLVMLTGQTGGQVPLWEELALGWAGVWETPYTAVLTVFLWFCGVCTAVVLRQGLRVLDTIRRGEPFSMENAVSLKRAAVCAFLISAAALARLIWGLCYYRSASPLATYNALFVPIFAMAGLLCLVMAALFRRAAEIKAENDLTI